MSKYPFASHVMTYRRMDAHRNLLIIAIPDIPTWLFSISGDLLESYGFTLHYTKMTSDKENILAFKDFTQLKNGTNKIYDMV